jgi:hypothetical protein
MWGDGLKREEKFVSLFGRDIANLTGRSVNITSYAHSGARLSGEDGSTVPVVDNEPQGDLDSSGPTTEQQAGCAAAAVSDAEIVLLDGCINDVSATKIALPFPFNFTSKEKIADDAAACGRRMKALVDSLTGEFRNATIVLINYYRVVSDDSTVLFNARVGGTQAPGRKGSSPDKVDRLTRERQKLLSESSDEIMLSTSQAKNLEAAFQPWDTNSEAFLYTSQTCFNHTVGSVDSLPHLPDLPDCVPQFPPDDHAPASPYLKLATPDARVFLATVPDDPEFAYGAPQTHLWHLPVKFLFWTFADHMYSVRKQLCKKAFSDDPLKQYKCSINAIAHPNVKGAQFYRDSLVSIFETAWSTSPSAVTQAQ